MSNIRGSRYFVEARTKSPPPPLPLGYLTSDDLPLLKLPPLQGEGGGGDGVVPAQKHPHPPPDLPLEGGGT
ncbi:MAG TPA: hypothetical protein DDY22_20865 [Geobacter sp.]|nr:hypothetical protein [Geobacter sp.]